MAIQGTESIVDPLCSSNLSKKGLCDYVVNVASGCLHGCTFCLGPETLILYADLLWRPLKDVRVGDVLLGFDEHPHSHVYRFLRPSVVEGVRRSRRSALKIKTQSTEVIATSNHGWLNGRGRWIATSGLTSAEEARKDGFSTIRSIGAPIQLVETDDYRIGYIVGMTLGDGTMRFDPNETYYGDYTPYWRVALCDFEPLERLKLYLSRFGVELHIRPYYAGSDKHRPASKVESCARQQVAKIYELLNIKLCTSEHYRGFLAGFFDAEGSFNQSLRVSQRDAVVLERFSRYAQAFNFNFKLEQFESACGTARLVGGFLEIMRFFSVCQPAIARKSEKLQGMAIKGFRQDPVISKTPVGEVDVIDIQTSTHTFFANGLASHNCYVTSTPTIRMREKVLRDRGVVDPQMDWGQYLFVREGIPEVLDQKLSRKRSWDETAAGKGVVLLCSTTDPYQNRQCAQVTREAVMVLLKHNKRVRILTRSPLWVNDLDVLVHPNVTVGMSLPYLNDELSRQIEPGAPLPSDRFKALAKGHKAGCRLFVAMAPTPPMMEMPDFQSHLEQLALLNPEIIFWEPINARGSNGKRMLAVGLEWAKSVMAHKSWASRFVEQWDMLEAAADATQLRDRLHIWPDPGLKGHVAQSRFDYWWDRPTVETWPALQKID